MIPANSDTCYIYNTYHSKIYARLTKLMKSDGKKPPNSAVGISMKSYLPDLSVKITELPVSSAMLMSEMGIWRDGGHLTVSSGGKYSISIPSCEKDIRWGMVAKAASGRRAWLKYTSIITPGYTMHIRAMVTMKKRQSAKPAHSVATAGRSHIHPPRAIHIPVAVRTYCAGVILNIEVVKFIKKGGNPKNKEAIHEAGLRPWIARKKQRTKKSETDTGRQHYGAVVVFHLH